MLVFIHINKTAGSTVRYMLRSTYGLRHCEAEPWHGRYSDKPFSSEDLPGLRKLYPRLASIAGHRIMGHVGLQENGTDFQYFTFMRDPVKTCASRFQYNIQYRGKTDLVFEDWIQQEWPRNHQTKRIAGEENVDRAIKILAEKQIFVGLTERFDESILLFKSLLAPDLNISYQRVNVARDNSIAKGLLETESTRQMLIEANEVDQALYDYVKSELYPLYRQEYGSELDADVAKYKESRDEGFNRLNLTLSRMKQYGVYRPTLWLYRKSRATSFERSV